MKNLQKIAALTIVAGGFLVAGMTGSVEAGFGGGHRGGFSGGHGGGHHASSFGHGYNHRYGYRRPAVVHYPHVDLLSDGHGHLYFVDSHGISRNCFRTSYVGRYFYYDNHHIRRYVLGH